MRWLLRTISTTELIELPDHNSEFRLTMQIIHHSVFREGFALHRIGMIEIMVSAPVDPADDQTEASQARLFPMPRTVPLT